MSEVPVDQLSGRDLRHAVATEVYGWQPTNVGVLGQMRYYTDRDEPQPEDCPLFELSVRQARKAYRKAAEREVPTIEVTIGNTPAPEEGRVATGMCRAAVRMLRAHNHEEAS